MQLRHLATMLVFALAATALWAGIRTWQDRGGNWNALLEAKYHRKVFKLDTDAFKQPYRSPDGSLVRAAWVQWEGGDFDLLGLPAHELGDSAEVVRRADLLPQQEWRFWCFQAFYPGEPDPWVSSPPGFALHWGVAHQHIGDTIVTHVAKVPHGESVYTGPETPHCEFRYTPSGWTLRKVEVFRR